MDRAKLLYVDDEEMNLLLFELNFKKFFEVETADSGAKALEILKNGSQPNIVVSDMKMPGLNGIEFLKEARKLLADTPFYILTGFEINEVIKSALQSGLIRSYIQKPFNRDLLLEEFNTIKVPQK